MKSMVGIRLQAGGVQDGFLVSDVFKIEIILKVLF